MTDITTIIFDLGGVLLDLDMNRCFHSMETLGIDFDKLNDISVAEASEPQATICEGITASGVMHLYQVGKISTPDFMGTLLSLCQPGTTMQQVVEAWNSCLLTIPEYKLNFIKELRAKGYHTYLLSNTNDAHWKYIEENDFPEPVSNYFDKTFLSQEMQLAKPNTDIYNKVLAEIDKKADECLFLDDSKSNCDAAESLGIHTYCTPVRSDFRSELIKRL